MAHLESDHGFDADHFAQPLTLIAQACYTRRKGTLRVDDLRLSPSGVRLSRGFTLVELSIVLVIIGLLIGGILAAQSMIETAKINAQVKQLRQFEIATSNFILNFKSLPGENPNIFNTTAKQSWGYITDENNNRRLDNAGSYQQEGFFFFPDLSESGMLTGQTYTPGYALQGDGITTSWPTPAYFGTPKIRTTCCPMDLKSIVGVTGNTSGDIFWTIDGTPNINAAWIRAIVPYSAPGAAPLSGKQALELDVKMDDGNPLTGKVRPFSDTMGDGGVSAPPDYPSFPIWTQDGVSDGRVYCANADGTYAVTSAEGMCGLVIKADVNTR